LQGRELRTGRRLTRGEDSRCKEAHREKSQGAGLARGATQESRDRGRRVLSMREVAFVGAYHWRFVPLREADTCGRVAVRKGRPHRWSCDGGGLVGHDNGGGQARSIPLAHGKGNNKNHHLRA